MTNDFNFGSLFNSGKQQESSATSSHPFEDLMKAMGGQNIPNQTSGHPFAELLSKLQEEMSGKAEDKNSDSFKSKAFATFEAKYGSTEEYVTKHFPARLEPYQDIALSSIQNVMQQAGKKEHAHVMIAAFSELARMLHQKHVMHAIENPLALIEFTMQAATMTKTLLEAFPDETILNSEALIAACFTVLRIKVAELQAHVDAKELAEGK